MTIAEAHFRRQNERAIRHDRCVSRDVMNLWLSAKDLSVCVYVNRSIRPNNVDRPGSAASCRRYLELNTATRSGAVRTGSHTISV
jgi:hypothetical protein